MNSYVVIYDIDRYIEDISTIEEARQVVADLYAKHGDEYPVGDEDYNIRIYEFPEDSDEPDWDNPVEEYEDGKLKM